jgi:hypothetical protein
MVTIPRDTISELFFIFTFKDSDYSYIISDLKAGAVSYDGQVFYPKRGDFLLRDRSRRS